MTSPPADSRVVIVGAGAAGLMTAIVARRTWPKAPVTVLDGARQLGRKILISGGGRCNVTNRVVRAADFTGGPRRAIARVLQAWTVDDTIAFFRGIGVDLREEPLGKLFPTTGRATTVLEALVRAATDAGAEVRPAHRVAQVQREGERFVIATEAGPFAAERVVLATGGLSVPQTGSDGAGYGFAQNLGHSIVPTTPALVPFLLGVGFHDKVAGVSHMAEVFVSVGGRIVARTTGSLLWTHVGVSGPAALDASRHWHRAVGEGASPAVQLNLRPGRTFEQVDGDLLTATRERPRAAVATIVSDWLPASLATALAGAAAVDPQTPMAHLARDARRALTHALVSLPLDVTGSRGYRVAEVTAGGVPLEEIDPATMASRRCSGLYLVGEILDVDGRIGGFNFQWAWASGAVAGRAVGRAIRNAECGVRN
jgi:predicted Rossmann fold flavoprotein